jgi:hypothetical protein
MNSWAGTEDCLSSIVACEPTAVLDAGNGCGLWGALLRQYLDASAGRIRPEQWRTRIDAVELDSSRVLPHAHGLYTEVLTGDVCEVVPRRAAEVRYDVILFDDVIEELHKDDGRALLEVTAGLAGRLVVARIRLGDAWLRAGDEGCGHQLSCWSLPDFTDHHFGGHRCEVRRYGPDADAYAVVTISASR